MSDIAGRESPEMYLKAIYLVIKEKGYCRGQFTALHRGHPDQEDLENLGSLQ